MYRNNFFVLGNIIYTMNSIISSIHSIFSIITNHVNDSWDFIKRSRKITPADILYLLTQKNYSGNSYDIILSSAKFDNIVNISKQALIKKRSLVPITFFTSLNKKLVNEIYKDGERKIVAFDGSQINLKRELHSEGYKLSDNKLYAVGMLSSAYEITKNIVLNYSLVKDTDERAVMIKQLDYLKYNDIVVADRGYYSKKLVKELIDRGIKFVLRLRSNSTLVTQMGDSTEINTIIRYKRINISVRVIQYEIDCDKKYKRIEDDTYYICTNVESEKDIEYIKNIYHKRWGVETDFRTAK